MKLHRIKVKKSTENMTIEFWRTQDHLRNHLATTRKCHMHNKMKSNCIIIHLKTTQDTPNSSKHIATHKKNTQNTLGTT